MATRKGNGKNAMGDNGFQIHCDAADAGSLNARTKSISVRIGQRIGIRDAELWDSIIVLCEELEDGVLSTKIIVCHPDWDDQLQIAHIRSQTANQVDSTPAFELDLKSVQV